MKFRLKALLGAAGIAMAAAATAQMTDQKSLEAAFDANVSSADQLGWLKQMSSAANHVGSAHDKANAEFELAQFKAFGWDAKIETFQVLYPTPISTTLEIVGATSVKLGGQEPAVAEDASSTNTADALPPYVAYQGDGDVTADLVYLNYGMPDDYDALARRGIDVRGKIVITRYGGGWRGLKPKLAQEHGAIGCIIYSDPADDGYGRGDVYPKGGARPSFGVQRGSVQDMTLYPGDPLTPGVGATPGAKRLTRETAPTILKIPALPISYGDAQKLLVGLTGPVAPANWPGALPLTYHMGGQGSVKVHLAVKSDWSMKTLYDVVATLKGSTEPDRWIVRGNHHDAWVFGASDPLSGQVALLSEAKALGALWAQGWRPKRTIVYTSWDGEEPGLLGSTEWAEQHAAELKAKAIVYVNTDNNGRGVLGAEASHDYQHLIASVANEVMDPETGVTIASRQRAEARVHAFEGTAGDVVAVAAAEKDEDMPVGALGSGSDYSAFLQHLGIASMNLGFGGEDESGGVYHSLYDSYYHMTTFDDPGLRYGAALSKTVGRIVLRLADADTPPQRFGDFAATVARYYGEVAKLEADRRVQDDKRDQLIAAGDFQLASDPLKPVGPPSAKPATPHIELAALANAVDRLKASAGAYDRAYAVRGTTLPPERRAKLNALLANIDQLLLDDAGLPGRPWFRNMVYAPGRFTGYGAKTLPGVREAIEERRFDDANIYAGRTAKVLEAYATRLDRARMVVEGS